jgi:death-on-curing protein
MPLYLTFDDVVRIHDRVVARSRDLPGFLNGDYGKGRVEAAVSRPQWKYHKHLFTKAAVLMEALGNNHGFVNGNKRTAFVATDAFLRINGYYLDIRADEAQAFIKNNMAGGTFNHEVIARWIQQFREKR